MDRSKLYDSHENKQKEWRAIQVAQGEKRALLRAPYRDMMEKLILTAKSEGLSFNQACRVSWGYLFAMMWHSIHYLNLSPSQK